MSAPIDFAGLAAALLDRAHLLVPQWLPGGKRSGAEYVCGDLSGGEGRSCSVNLTTGAWADFSGDDRGADLISLYAAIHGLNQGQAAHQLMQDMGWSRPEPARPGSRGPAPRAAGSADEPPDDGAPPAGEEGGAGGGARKTVWQPVIPVPAHAPAPTFKHWHYTEPEATWEYTFEGERYGYVVRFRNSSGGKEILPYTWCQDTGDHRGTCRWHWKQWDDPRPLYVPATLLSADARLPVVLVEGEKCALALHQLLGHEFDVVTWPGGSKAWAKARWGWLMGRTVYLWPDADAKRQRLTRDERAAQVDPETKPLLPEHLQPGMQAMVGIGSMLVADQGCTVLMCPVPAPGAVADGWDVADAIASGWGPEEVRAFIRGARAFVPPDEAAGAKAGARAASEGLSTPTNAGAGREEEASDAWRGGLIKSGTGAIKAVRENVVLALDGIPAERLPGIPEAAGVVAFNEFTNDVMKLQDAPWGTPAGVWDEVDELEMGDWLCRQHWMPSMPRGTLEEAVAVVAKRHRYHPVRDYLDSVRGKWDGMKRCATWLQRCCLEEDEWDPRDPLQQYLSRVGTWVLMAMCARVLQPGCKFDYMLILEGPQGWRKSTLARELGQAWFADTGLVLGEKDSYQNLQGIWLYEWAELDSLNKADVQKVKQFISSQKDRFRASFDRRPKDYPRQVVFVGTTNEDHYLSDSTGNRRFWPVRVSRIVDIDWLRENRDQLFAEALQYMEAGERFHPTPREQRELFDPQQSQRQIESAIGAAVMRYLYDEGQRVGVSGENGTLVNEISAPELLSRLGVSVDKQTHVLLRQVTAQLRIAGWTRFRSTRGDRPWMFRRPPVGAGGSSFDPDAHQATPGGSGSFNGPTQGHPTERPDSDCPF